MSYRTIRSFLLAVGIAGSVAATASLPASATDWYQPGDPTQKEVERVHMTEPTSDDSDVYGGD